jgi:hypothetical protein
MAVSVAVLLLLGFLNKSDDSRTEILEGILDWRARDPGFYPGGDCTQRYEYAGARKPSADLNARRAEMGKPNALWVKIRGWLSAFGSEGHTGASFHREVVSTEIIDVRLTRGCLF